VLNLFTRILGNLLGTTKPEPTPAPLTVSEQLALDTLNKGFPAPVRELVTAGNLANGTVGTQTSTIRRSRRMTDLYVEQNRSNLAVKVGSKGVVQIPAAVLRAAGFNMAAGSYVDVQLHPNSITVKDGVGNHNSLQVKLDGRVSLTTLMTEQIGLDPGDTVYLKIFTNKITVTKNPI
jgi:antitoxin component of MazEF toxin-antitoxin module